MTYLLSVIEQEKARKDKDYVDTSKQIALKISRLEPDARAKVVNILGSMRTAILLYMVFSSLFFTAVVAVFLILRRTGLWRPGRREPTLQE